MRHLLCARENPLHYSTLLIFPMTHLISHYSFSLSGIVFPMVFRSGRARMLRRSRPGQWRFDPLCAEVTIRICNLDGQTVHPGWLQGTIRCGRSSLHRWDCARAKGKASAPFARAGKSRLGTDKRSLLSMNACLLFRYKNMLNLRIFWI